MKTIAAIALTIAAIQSVVAYDEVTPCPWTEFFKLAPLASDPNLKPCQDASKWQMVPPTGYPTPEQRAIMCKTPQCFALIESVKKINPSDCVLSFGDVKFNVKKMAEEFEASCWN